MSDATRIRLAAGPPPHCAACFNQQPDKQHVDFGASYDGPFLRGEVTGGPTVSIDDLILCEDCLKAGARELGLVEADELKQALIDAASREENFAERLHGAMTYIRKLEEATSARDDLEERLGLKKKEKV